jgi:hypothetical protein
MAQLEIVLAEDPRHEKARRDLAALEEETGRGTR